MLDATTTQRRMFCVHFRDIQTWNVGAQFELKWNWPASDIKPLASVLRCSVPAHCIDPRRLPLFIARSALRDLIVGLQAVAEGVQTV